MKAGYNYCDTTELFHTRYEIEPAKLPAGVYRNITGSTAMALGFVAASRKSGLPLFQGAYPITPASDLLHELSMFKNFGVTTFQAEDEIAAICAAIGASFGGALGLTTTTGPGLALKSEAIGLAMMAELPLVIINVQRGGPSTGLPTKTEQADLLQALFGRNGEAPLPVLAASSPADCFARAIEACRIAVRAHDAGDAALRRLHRQRRRALAPSGDRRPAPTSASSSTPTPKASCPTSATRRRSPGRGRFPDAGARAPRSAASRSRTAPATSATTRRTTSRWSGPAGGEGRRGSRDDIPPRSPRRRRRRRSWCSAGVRPTARSPARSAPARAEGRQDQPRSPALPEPVPAEPRRDPRALRAGPRARDEPRPAGSVSCARKYLVDAVGLEQGPGPAVHEGEIREDPRSEGSIEVTLEHDATLT